MSNLISLPAYAAILEAAHWIPFLDETVQPAEPAPSPAELDAYSEAIDKLERRELIGAATAALLRDVYAIA